MIAEPEDLLIVSCATPFNDGRIDFAIKVSVSSGPKGWVGTPIGFLLKTFKIRAALVLAYVRDVGISYKA